MSLSRLVAEINFILKRLMDITLVTNSEHDKFAPKPPHIELVSLDCGSNPSEYDVRHFLLSVEQHQPSEDTWCLWEICANGGPATTPEFSLLAFCNHSLFKGPEAAGSALLGCHLRRKLCESDAQNMLPRWISGPGLINEADFCSILAEAYATEGCLRSWVRHFETTGNKCAGAEFVESEPRLLTLWRDALNMWDVDLFGVIHEQELALEDGDLNDYLLPELRELDRESVLQFMSEMVQRVEEGYPNALSLMDVSNSVVAVESVFCGKWYEAESLSFFQNPMDCHLQYHNDGCYLNGDSNDAPDLELKVWQETYLLELFNKKLAARLGFEKVDV